MDIYTGLRVVGMATAWVFSAIPVAVMAANPAPDTAVFINPHLARPATGSPQIYTREQIRNAKPLPWVLPAATGAKVQNATALQTVPTAGAPVVTVEPVLPDPDADWAARRDFAGEWALLEQAQPLTVVDAPDAFAQPLATPAAIPGPLQISKHPYTLYPGNYWKEIQTRFPWKAVGKLIFKDRGTPYIGTANVIYSPQGNLIVTAAHNVFSPGAQPRFHTDFVFIPAERDGVAPYGQFPFKTARVLLRWKEGNWSARDDVALLTLQNNQAGKPVSYYTGGLGLKMNLPYMLNVTAMGYSGGGVMSSKATTISTGQTFFFDGKDCSGFQGGEDILFMGSTLTSGSSGGAWLYKYQPFDSLAKGNYVTSVVSQGIGCGQGMDPPVPEIVLGPRFSEANIGVLCAYEGCKPEPRP